MSIAAGLHSSGPSFGSLSLYAQVGLGLGGIILLALLVYLLAYLQVVTASERELRHLRTLLVAVIVPLQIAFFGVLAYEILLGTAGLL